MGSGVALLPASTHVFVGDFFEIREGLPEPLWVLPLPGGVEGKPRFPWNGPAFVALRFRVKVRLKGKGISIWRRRSSGAGQRAPNGTKQPRHWSAPWRRGPGDYIFDRPDADRTAVPGFFAERIRGHGSSPLPTPTPHLPSTLPRHGRATTSAATLALEEILIHCGRIRDSPSRSSLVFAELVFGNWGRNAAGKVYETRELDGWKRTRGRTAGEISPFPGQAPRN